MILYMISLSAALVAGILTGLTLRKGKGISLNWASSVIILVLIFSLGFGIGSNNELLGSLPKVGLSAVVIAVMTIVFSVVFVKAVKRAAGLK